MDIQLGIGRRLIQQDLRPINSRRKDKPTRPFCSRNDPPQQNNGGGGGGGNNRDKFSTDWDKAWSSFKKQGKKSLLSQFSPNKYVTWNPKRSNFPLSEEVDPIKRAERSNLMLWTSPGFTLGGAIVIVTFLLEEYACRCAKREKYDKKKVKSMKMRQQYGCSNKSRLKP